MRDINLTTLKNGLRIVSDRMETVETVSVGVWVNVGTRDERFEVNGISHLLEHMAFKGTRKRNAYAIASEIEAVGGHLNAYTSRENTAYYAKVLKENLPLAVEIIGDILQYSLMDKKELERERAVILQEIHQTNDTPDDIIFDHFQGTAFPDQPMGQPILGRSEVIQKLDSAHLLSYMGDHYSTPNLVLTAAGRLDHLELVQIAESVFTSIPTRSVLKRGKANYKGGDFHERRNLEQVHLVMGVKGLSYRDEDFYSASILSTLLGGGMSSRLFQEVREKRGLAYAISSFLSCYTDAGIFGIYAGTGPKEVPSLVQLVLEEFDKVKNQVTSEEIERARAQLKANLLMGLESTTSRCEQLAQHMLIFGSPISTKEIIEKVNAVDETGVIRVAERLFKGTPTVASIGPTSDNTMFEPIANRLKN
ncbi:MAG: peptidase M16 [Magnetovibrio sp.]|nr:peptidase M16 [Magnetovibrio sp.]